MNNPDVADIIAGALQTSRAHAYELMREALAEQLREPRESPQPTNQGGECNQSGEFTCETHDKTTKNAASRYLQESV